MQIDTKLNVVTISGNIKSIANFLEIKRVLDTILRSKRDIIIKIPDSISMTSSVIGYFNKLVLKDNIKLTLMIGNAMLLDLLNDLNLASLFNTRMF